MSFSNLLTLQQENKRQYFTYPGNRSDISNKILLHSACSKRQIRAVPSLLPLMNLEEVLKQKLIHLQNNLKHYNGRLTEVKSSTCVQENSLQFPELLERKLMDR